MAREERADKQRQHDVVRSHGRTIGRDLIDLLGLELDGGGEVVRHAVGIVLEHVGELAERLALGKALHVAREPLQTGRERIRQVHGGGEGILRLAEGGLIAAERILQAGELLSSRAEDGAELAQIFARVRGHLVEGTVHAVVRAEDGHAQVLADPADLAVELLDGFLPVGALLDLLAQVGDAVDGGLQGAAHLGELVEDGVCGQLLELFLLGGELLIDLVKPARQKLVPLRRVAERLVDGLLHAVELLVDAVKRINHLRQLRVFGQELRGRARWCSGRTGGRCRRRR